MDARPRSLRRRSTRERDEAGPWGLGAPTSGGCAPHREVPAGHAPRLELGLRSVHGGDRRPAAPVDAPTGLRGAGAAGRGHHLGGGPTLRAVGR